MLMLRPVRGTQYCTRGRSRLLRKGGESSYVMKGADYLGATLVV